MATYGLRVSDACKGTLLHRKKLLVTHDEKLEESWVENETLHKTTAVAVSATDKAVSMSKSLLHALQIAFAYKSQGKLAHKKPPP